MKCDSDMSHSHVNFSNNYVNFTFGEWVRRGGGKGQQGSFIFISRSLFYK